MHAALDAEVVIPVYIHTPRGEEGTGAASQWWRHHSLVRLKEALLDAGSRLVIRADDDPLHALLQLVRETGATEVHWNRLYEPAAVARDAQTRHALREEGIGAESHAGHLLHEPSQKRTKAGTPFRVFTPFWRSLLAEIHVPAPLPVPHMLKAPAQWPASLAVDDLALLPVGNWADGLRRSWYPGEVGAHSRLQAFLAQELVHYARGRDFPADEHVSRLSPHLHFGELTPRQLWHAVIASTAPEDAQETWLRQLGWREFSHHVLFNFPHTQNQPLYEKYREFPWREDHALLLRAWQRGETGYPIVDAGMRELWQTGWMHNRVRMIAASLLVKNLRVPWQKGAAWFADTLVDADLANNTMGWQWSAGCGADSAPYFRIFNPMTQSVKFDAAEYIRRFVPELKHLPDKYVHQPWDMPLRVQRETGFVPGRDYPLPVVDYRESREAALDALRALSGG